MVARACYDKVYILSTFNVIIRGINIDDIINVTHFLNLRAYLIVYVSTIRIKDRYIK